MSKDIPIKVAVLTTSFPLGMNSTSGIFVQRLVSSLPQWVDVKVITPCSSKPIDDSLSKNYHIKCFKYAPNSWQVLAHEPGGIPVAIRYNKLLLLFVPMFLFSMFISCTRVARRCDVIHANWSVNGLIAGLSALLTKTPVVTTLRGEDFTKMSKSWFFKKVMNVCVRLNDKIIAVSEAIYKDLLIYYPNYKDKFIFISNGVENKYFESNASEANKQKDTVNILSIGSLIQRKGIDTIIKSFGLLSNENKACCLNIIGTGHEEKKLKKLASEYGIDNKVKFLGSITPDEIPRYLANSDIFILASHSEGRPNVVLESFAANVAVIATEIDGVKELITDNKNGLLFEPGNIYQLADKIKTLAENSEIRSKIAKNGKKFIFDNDLFWPSVGNKYAAVYKQLCLK